MTSGLISSYVGTKLAMRASAEDLTRRRARLWAGFENTLRATPALQQFAGRAVDDIPGVTPSAIRQDYGAWNSLGLTHQQLLAAAQDNEAGGSGEVLPGFTCGFSTGTSGQRGLFIASGKERGTYLGQSLARLLPLSTLIKGARIGLILRANNALYEDIGKAKHFGFRHFPLTLDSAALFERLQGWNPTVLIAPAHKLALLAKGVETGQLKLTSLTHVFTGSEPMREGERDWIGSALGVRPDPIYQATEGFLAGACRFGRLHLNEHTLEVRKSPVAGTSGWQPIVTDLARTSQPIVNVTLDDFLEDDDGGPCPCGYAGRTIKPVMGRVSDLWHLDDRVITPRVVSSAMEACVGPKADWQAVATSKGVVLGLPLGWSVEQKKAVCRAFMQHLGLNGSVSASHAPIPEPAPKRRRVIWQSEAHHHG